MTNAVVGFYELDRLGTRVGKGALNTNPDIQGSLPVVGDYVTFLGAGETEVPGTYRVRSRSFVYGQVSVVEPTVAITIVVERVDDSDEVRRVTR